MSSLIDNNYLAMNTNKRPMNGSHFVPHDLLKVLSIFSSSSSSSTILSMAVTRMKSNSNESGREVQYIYLYKLKDLLRNHPR